MAILQSIGCLISHAIEEYFLKNAIKHTIVGGFPFYARKEIKDIMAYLRFIYNSQDTQGFKRIINTKNVAPETNH